MSEITGKSALVTGGASGLGRCLGEFLLNEGASKLVLLDINQEFLDRTVSELRLKNKNVFGFQVDVSDTEKTGKTISQILAEVGDIDILINNAGIVIGKDFKNHTVLDIDITMKVNTTALMHITRELLPTMLKRKSGHIVNIASAAGLVSNPKMSVYCASKWAVIGWSDSLRLEMDFEKSGVNVTTVTPYYIDTGMFSGVRSPLIPIIKPPTAAAKIIKGIKKNSKFVRMPWIINLLPFVKGILPTVAFDFVLGKIFRIYKTMDTFKGHSK